MAKRKKRLTVALLCEEAIRFAEIESTYPEPTLYGVTDGKAIGTYLEHKLRAHLEAIYDFAPCNSASGIGCNAEDLIGLMHDKNLPVDDIEANEIAEELLKTPCEQGYLTISNALQWRLQYGRVIGEAGKVEGIRKLR